MLLQICYIHPTTLAPCQQLVDLQGIEKPEPRGRDDLHTMKGIFAEQQVAHTTSKIQDKLRQIMQMRAQMLEWTGKAMLGEGPVLPKAN